MVEAQGNQYTTTNATTSNNLYVSKFNPQGAHVWSLFLISDGSVGCHINSMAADAQGNLYVSGKFSGTIDFNPNGAPYNLIGGITTNTGFLAKYDSSGQLLFATNFVDRDNIVRVGSTGTLYLVQGDNYVSSLYNLHLSRLNPVTGAAIWSKDVTGNTSQLFDVSIDSANNIYIAAFLTGTMVFDSTTTITTGSNAHDYIVKYDNAGNFSWVKPLSHSSYVRVAAYSDQGFYVSSRFSDTLGIDSTVYAVGMGSYLAKFDSDANVTWVRYLLQDTPTQGIAGGRLAVGRNDVYQGGQYSGLQDFDPSAATFMSQSTGDTQDAFVSHYSTDGELINVMFFPAAGYEGVYGMAVDTSGNVIISGEAPLNIDTDPGNGVQLMLDDDGGFFADVFIIKLSDAFNTASGVAFVDANANGIYDTTEFPFPNAIITATTGNTAVSSSSGAYHHAYGTGSVTVAAQTLLHYNVQPPSYHFNYATTGNSDSLNNFAYTRVDTIPDMSIVSTPLTAARPGFDFVLRVDVNNIGTADASGYASVKFPSQLVLDSTTILPTAITSDSLAFDVALAPFQTTQALLYFSIPATASLGDTLEINAFAFDTTNVDSATSAYIATFNADNSDTNTVVITGSYDPNDKTVEPIGDLNIYDVQAGQRLTYTVRFQNTGTDTAFTVVVQDTLSPYLDYSTLETVAASHPYTQSLSSGGLLVYQFNEILLTDTATNDAGSHGFVTYRISAFQNLSAGTHINNTAYIYFDYNTPIITNTTTSTVAYPLAIEGTPVKMTGLIVSPNPADQQTVLIITFPQVGLYRGVVTDYLGRTVKSIFTDRVITQFQSSYALDTSDLLPGLYLVSITDEAGKVMSCKLSVLD